jgi:hypothetical protein
MRNHTFIKEDRKDLGFVIPASKKWQTMLAHGGCPTPDQSVTLMH